MNLVTLLSVCVFYASILTQWENSKTLCGILNSLSCCCQDGIRDPQSFNRGKAQGEEMRAKHLGSCDLECKSDPRGEGESSRSSV